MSLLSDPALQPFGIAALVLAGLVAIEIVGALAGLSLSETLEGTALGEFAETGLGWLNLGKAPFLVLVMIALALFAVCGLAVQFIAGALAGPLPAGVASLAALAAAIPATRIVSRWVGRILPRDESYAIHDDQLVGKKGVVTVGPLEAASVGRVRVTDAFGNRHFPRARPLDPGERIEVGASIVIMQRAGREYRVARAPAAPPPLDAQT